MNKHFLLTILSMLLMSIASCTVYVSPDSATISKGRTIPAADPNYTTPAAIPTTSTKTNVITEIRSTPVTQPTKKDI